MYTFQCTYTKPVLEAIAAKNPELAVKIDNECSFVKAEDVAGIIAVDPSINVLVRCGNGRFTCTIFSLKWHLEAIRNGKSRFDYVRDVSIACVN